MPPYKRQDEKEQRICAAPFWVWTAFDFAKEKKLQWDAKKADTNEIVDVEDFSDQIFEENHDREYRTIHITSPEEDHESENLTTDSDTEASTEVNLTEDIPEVTPLPDEELS